jgi:hypothetical protein
MNAPRFEEWATGLVLFALLESAMIWWRIQAAPVVWIGLLWIFVLAVRAAGSRPRRRALWANTLAALVAVVLVEGLLYLSGPRNPYLLPPNVRFVGDMARPNYFIQAPAPGLGYQPRAGMRILATKMDADQIVYSVRYSVGPDGLRIRPPAVARPTACLLMFGDSIAWGEGVNDEDTAAYRIGAWSKGAIRVANFAFTGYSAHQMLWQIDSGMVAARSGCDASLPVVAIYQSLPNNVGRVAGSRGWDEYGPRYILLSNGKVRYVGSFALGDYALHDTLFIPAAIAGPLSHVNLYSRILGRERRLDDFDRERFAAIVKTAEADLRSRYPRLTFLVVVWPEPPNSESDPGTETSRFIGSLMSRGLRVLSASDIVPEFRTNPTAVGIAGDGHPTAATHIEIARYLAAHVIRPAAD